EAIGGTLTPPPGMARSELHSRRAAGRASKLDGPSARGQHRETRQRGGDVAGRVLHLAAGNLYGGVETFLVTLARSPRRLEHRLALFFEGRLASELRAAGADVEVLGPARLGRPWTLVGPQL